MVSGVAFFDFDNDGLLDVFLTNGAKMTDLDKTDPVFWNRLYRNLGGWKFEDVTEKAGVKGHGYDNGVATADYDNDGWTDLFVAGLRENVLYRNKGDGTFEDTTAKAGLKSPDPDYGTLWAVAAAFFDYDKDGDLDLFVSNYCIWDPKTEPLCGPRGMNDYCHPNNYKGLPNSLFRNEGERHLHRRLEALGDPRGRRQGDGPRGRRLRPGRLDRRLRRQRHRAQLPLPQPRQREVRGDRLHGRRRLPRGGPAALGHGRRRPGPRRRRQARHLPHRALQRDDAGLPEPGEQHVPRDDRPGGRLVAEPLARGLGQRHRGLQQRREEGPLRGGRRRHGPERRVPGEGPPDEPRDGQPRQLQVRRRDRRSPGPSSRRRRPRTAARPSGTSTTTAAWTPS